MLYTIVIQIIGGLYPSYLAYKALKRNDGPEIIRLVMYFIVFQVFCSIEFYLDLFIAFWLPFYYESKLIFIFWLISSYGNGAKILYENLISKKFDQYEENIDKQIDNVQKLAIDSLWKLFYKFHIYISHLLVLGMTKAQMAAIHYVNQKNQNSNLIINNTKNTIKMLIDNTNNTNNNEEEKNNDIPIIEMIETDENDNDFVSKSLILTNNDDDNNNEFIKLNEMKKPIKRTKRKRKIIIDDENTTTTSPSSLIQSIENSNKGPFTRSRAANNRINSI